MKKLFGLTGMMILLASCGPQIDIHTPTEDQTFVTEGSIPITATITDPDGIKRVTIRYENSEWDIFPTNSPTTYELNDWGTMTSHYSGYVVVITVEVEDMKGHISEKQAGAKHS